MKKSFILLILFGCINTAIAQKSKTTPVITRYYYFTGAIDKYPVTFQLYRNNERFSGSYYYNNTEEAIDISGFLDKSQFLKLTHSDKEGNVTEVLSRTPQSLHPLYLH